MGFVVLSSLTYSKTAHRTMGLEKQKQRPYGPGVSPHLFVILLFKSPSSLVHVFLSCYDLCYLYILVFHFPQPPQTRNEHTAPGPMCHVFLFAFILIVQ